MLHYINARQRVMLAAAELRGLTLIRVAIVAFRAHRRQVEMLLEDENAGS